MTIKCFLDYVQRNAQRISQYQKGGDGTNGRCDCIGLIIGAWKLAGNKWPWLHGSNYTARYLIKGLANVEKAGDLQPGMLVFKYRHPGEAGYALPDTYWDHPDRKDYYHVGVVTETDPLQIIHCTDVQGGIMRDSKAGQWKAAGWLNMTQEEHTDMEHNFMARVISKNGKKVNLRKGPSLSGELITSVPPEALLLVTGFADDIWASVTWNDKSGYMMRKYLQPETQEITTETIDKVLELLWQAETILESTSSGCTL